MTTRRQFVAASLGLAASGFIQRAYSLDIPGLPANAPLRLTMGFPAGGAVDVVARVLAPSLSAVLSRPVIPEYITGANGALALRRVAEPGGDPTRVFFATSSIAEAASAGNADTKLLATLRQVTVTSTLPMVLLVRSSLGIKDAAGFMARLKSSPEMTYGSSGLGNGTHLCAADLVERLSAKAVHVPYQGAAPVMLDLAGGHIDFAMIGASSLLVPNPRVMPIAVSMLSRSSQENLKDLPTISESMVNGFEHSLWQAVFAPPSWDSAQVNALNAAFKTVLSQDSVKQALSKSATEVVASAPAAVSQWIAREVILHKRINPASRVS